MNLPQIEFLVLPYSSLTGNSLAEVLIREFGSGNWTRFQAAVAFAKVSGNFPDLLQAMKQFLNANGEISITFGADTFSGNAKGSDQETVEQLLDVFAPYAKARIFFYREEHRTFHPKVYLFSNVGMGQALLIVGSSNWSSGGLLSNVEANLLVRLDLEVLEQKDLFTSVSEAFSTYWMEGNT